MLAHQSCANTHRGAQYAPYWCGAHGVVCTDCTVASLFLFLSLPLGLCCLHDRSEGPGSGSGDSGPPPVPAMDPTLPASAPSAATTDQPCHDLSDSVLHDLGQWCNVHCRTAHDLRDPFHCGCSSSFLSFVCVCARVVQWHVVADGDTFELGIFVF